MTEAQEQRILRIIKELGIPTAMLVVALLALYNGAGWVANTVIAPALEDNRKVMQTQIETITSLTTTQKAITDSIVAQTEALRQMAVSLKQIEINTHSTSLSTEKIQTQAQENGKKLDRNYESIRGSPIGDGR